MTAATLTCDEPAFRFWLRYAEREGGLVEGHGDHALVLLPEALQQASGLPEEVSLTDQPDVSREDGATLLIAGHPAVERATGALIAEGDTGTCHQPWPAGRPPTRSQLEVRARENVQVDHGRIDAAGEPVAAYLPLLRVGAVVAYTASLTLRFQEQEEVWLDARSCLEVSDRLRHTVSGRAFLARPDGPGRRLAADLDGAVAAAHALLEARAVTRRRALTADAGRALATELTRADAYYEAALDSIGRRRETASADRARLLDEQASATRAEHTRRRRELADAHEPRHDIRPYRLHVVYVPCYLLAVDVRRGNRRFPSEVCWIPATGEFAAGRCPACGSDADLVAGREALICRSCVPGGTDRTERRPLQIVTSTPTEEPPAAERVVRSQSPATSSRSRGARAVKWACANPPAVTRRQSPMVDIQRAGNKVALAFWQCVADGERWPRQKTMPDSPIRALYRLYGAAGPCHAIGMPAGVRPERVEAATRISHSGGPEMTSGVVGAGGERFDYTLLWWLKGGKPVIGEVIPGEDPLDLPPRRLLAGGLDDRLRGGAPLPGLVLDPVAAALWSTELERHGLPLTVRCLSAWWGNRLEIMEGTAPGALAAAVAAAVLRGVGIQVIPAAHADAYAATPAGLEAAGRLVESIAG